jgi:hypothetical protein
MFCPFYINNMLSDPRVLKVQVLITYIPLHIIIPIYKNSYNVTCVVQTSRLDVTDM